MTKTERINHIEKINSILAANSLQDRWGMYHIGSYKFDTRKNNLKVYRHNVKIQSELLTNIGISWFEKYVIALNLKEQNN